VKSDIDKPTALPDPNKRYPVPNADVTYIKPTITRRNIIVGDFTYYSGLDFEAQVTRHYEFYGDKLIIGKFCQIAKDVEFIMNGANYRDETDKKTQSRAASL
jgi:virginiamycin A acetyltransferase